ncbi:hypothetical protein [Streptomyces sp. BBFR109]|uniref:hypothetical protein n=1 Tax=Streptomyces sp. BBFR109 TaxID=3448172 RepID=UPI003F75D66D
MTEQTEDDFWAQQRAQAVAERGRQADPSACGTRVLTPERQAENAAKHQAAELAAFRALDLGDVDGRVSASCDNPEHPTWLRKPDDVRGCPWCRIAELETYAHGCDAEGCVLPHSSWCERAKKTAAENNGCTCGQPWAGHPQPHAMHCWSVNPPRSEVDAMRARIAGLEAERKKYVGTEPTIAEEVAYLSRCVDSVLDLCQKAEQQAGRWEQPFPVPEWVPAVRAAAEGLVPRETYPPALPWAALMDDEDLQDFLTELASMATESADPTAALAKVEETCGLWRTLAEAQHAHNTAPGPDAEGGEQQ